MAKRSLRDPDPGVYIWTTQQSRKKSNRRSIFHFGHLRLLPTAFATD